MWLKTHMFYSTVYINHPWKVNHIFLTKVKKSHKKYFKIENICNKKKVKENFKEMLKLRNLRSCAKITYINKDNKNKFGDMEVL